jgi:simple sugar transport system ATP-binding protein
MNKYLLQVNNISKKFGNIQALNKVNLSLEQGVVYGLLGENGAGKSTLMNILSGIYMPDSGSINGSIELYKR